MGGGSTPLSQICEVSKGGSDTVIGGVGAAVLLSRASVRDLRALYSQLLQKSVVKGVLVLLTLVILGINKPGSSP